MILDTETNAKSPTLPGRDSQPQSPASPTPSSFFAYSVRGPHVSYSTFPISGPPSAAPHANASDITTLLGRGVADLSNDEEPPAYDDINITRKIENRFWTRCAAIVLTILLAYSTWSSYQFTKGTSPNPNSPSQLPPTRPSDTPFPPTSPPAPPVPSPTASLPAPPSPSSPPSHPPLPPISPLPSPSDLQIVLPDLGRVDLCRPWAYLLDSGVHPAHSNQLPTDRLIYNIPTLAPIHLETVAICPTADGANKPCTEYDSSTDAISGNLRVVAADVELPKMELFVQHGSELGLEDVSVCLMKRPIVAGGQIGLSGGYKWSLGIYIWKDSTSHERNNLLASLSIILTLPSTRVLDLTTNLDFFTQIIGSKKESFPYRPSFETLELAGNYGRIEVWNTDARVINGHSLDTPLAVLDSRISRSLSLKSNYGIISCNVTLVQNENEPPVQVDVQSSAGVVDLIADLEYSLSTPKNPLFEIAAYSRFSRAMLFITDQKGTAALRNGLLPTVLPTIRMNLTSEFAIAQALIPATYSGILDLRSQHAEIGTVDNAKDLLGRDVEWYSREPGTTRGAVHWNGVHSAREGYLHVSTEYAAARLLFFGLDDDSLIVWPKESNGMEAGWSNSRDGLRW